MRHFKFSIQIAGNEKGGGEREGGALHARVRDRLKRFLVTMAICFLVTSEAFNMRHFKFSIRIAGNERGGGERKRRGLTSRTLARSLETFSCHNVDKFSCHK